MTSPPAGQTGQDGVPVANVTSVLLTTHYEVTSHQDQDSSHQDCAVQGTIRGHHSLHRPVAGIRHIIRGETHHVVQRLHVVSLADADLGIISLEYSDTSNSQNIPEVAWDTRLPS